MVDRRGFYRNIISGFRWHGATGYQLWICVDRVAVLSGVMMASTVDLERVMQIPIFRMDKQFDGEVGFLSAHMRCVLRFNWTGCVLQTSRRATR